MSANLAKPQKWAAALRWHTIRQDRNPAIAGHTLWLGHLYRRSGIRSGGRITDLQLCTLCGGEQPKRGRPAFFAPASGRPRSGDAFCCN